jgi:type II secretory pathway pseudopilin PulG
MIFLALLSIAVMVVSPMVFKVMQREREQELIFRGKQYAQALLVYKKRTGNFPIRLDQLMETQPRSARKLWKDPMCGCSDWGLIRVGEPWPIPPPGSTATTPAVPGAPGGQPASPSPETGLPKTYTSPPTPPAGFGTGTEPGRGAQRPGQAGTGAGFSEDALFKEQNTDQSNVPIVGVYSKVHKKGIRTFKGQEYYDQWGFIAGQNNDDLPQLIPPVPAYFPPNPASQTTAPGTTGSSGANSP